MAPRKRSRRGSPPPKRASRGRVIADSDSDDGDDFIVSDGHEDTESGDDEGTSSSGEPMGDTDEDDDELSYEAASSDDGAELRYGFQTTALQAVAAHNVHAEGGGVTAPDQLRGSTSATALLLSNALALGDGLPGAKMSMHDVRSPFTDLVREAAIKTFRAHQENLNLYPSVALTNRVVEALAKGGNLQAVRSGIHTEAVCLMCGHIKKNCCVQLRLPSFVTDEDIGKLEKNIARSEKRQNELEVKYKRHRELYWDKLAEEPGTYEKAADAEREKGGGDKPNAESGDKKKKKKKKEEEKKKKKKESGKKRRKEGDDDEDDDDDDDDESGLLSHAEVCKLLHELKTLKHRCGMVVELRERFKEAIATRMLHIYMCELCAHKMCGVVSMANESRRMIVDLLNLPGAQAICERADRALAVNASDAKLLAGMPSSYEDHDKIVSFLGGEDAAQQIMMRNAVSHCVANINECGHRRQHSLPGWAVPVDPESTPGNAEEAEEAEDDVFSDDVDSQ